MWSTLTVRLAVWLLRTVSIRQPDRTALFEEVIEALKKKTLSVEERQLCTALLLDRLGALPLRAKIVVDETGKVFVNGRTLEAEHATRLKQAAVAMRNNAARNLVRETVTFMAITDGVHKNINPEMGLFAKAALWFLQEENALYDTLASEFGDDD